MTDRHRGISREAREPDEQNRKEETVAINFKNTTWESVSEGQELPVLEFGPLTATNLLFDASGTRDSYPIHHDRDFARANGVPDIFVNTQWYQGLLGRYATDWGGPESFLRSLSFDMRAPNHPGDLLNVHGSITRKYEQDGQKRVDLDVRIDNEGGTDTVVARMTLELI